MTKIDCIIRSYKLEDVRRALKGFKIEEIYAGPVRGFGRDKGRTQYYRGSEYSVEFLPKLRLEIYVTSADADGVIEAIQASARTGRIGDGKLFVYGAEEKTSAPARTISQPMNQNIQQQFPIPAPPA